MRALMEYIRKQQDVRSVALFLGGENVQVCTALAYLKELETIDLYVASPQTGEQLTERLAAEYAKIGRASVLVQTHELRYIHEVADGTHYDLVYADEAVSEELMQAIQRTTPRVFAARICGYEFPYFAVWDAYRKVSERIYIQRIGREERVELLNWEQREDTPELSVVFPVYNVAQYLPKCIETVTAWDFDGIEFLFVNDGSPDESRELILQYAAKDPRIRLIDKENGGCASARQCGMEAARGRYVGFFDPDDFIDPTMYQKLLARALMGGYDICYCGYKEYYESDGSEREVPDTIGEPYIYGITDENEIHKLIMYTRVAIWRGIYRREFLVIKKLGFYTDLRRFDDLPFKVETFANADSVVTVPEYLYYYRLQRPGQDVACTDERLYVHFDIFRHLEETLGASKNQHLIDELQVVKFQTHIYAYEKIDEVLRKDYNNKMMQDLRVHMTDKRTRRVLSLYLGRKVMLKFVLLRHGMHRLYRWYAKQLERKNT